MWVTRVNKGAQIVINGAVLSFDENVRVSVHSLDVHVVCPSGHEVTTGGDVRAVQPLDGWLRPGG